MKWHILIPFVLLNLVSRRVFSLECSAVFSERFAFEKLSAAEQYTSTNLQVNFTSVQFRSPRRTMFVIRHKNLREDGEKKLLLRAYLDHESGLLTYQIVSRTSHGDLVDPNVFAKSLFKMMIDHYGLAAIHKIQAEWYWNTENSLAPNILTNSIQYREKIVLGIPAVVAAQQTWTGRMANSYGFSEVEINGIKEYENGPFMLVSFKRPTFK